MDWATFEMSGTYFPAENRDNFGKPFGFLEYDWLWNVGDQNGFYSHAWLDPIPGGRVFTFGASSTGRTGPACSSVFERSSRWAAGR